MVPILKEQVMKMWKKKSSLCFFHIHGSDNFDLREAFASTTVQLR